MADKKKFTHSELNNIAVKWLLRSVGSNGAGCQMAVSEIQAVTQGANEIADAFGYRCSSINTKGYGSWLIESKTSRGDFLADAKKNHRVHTRLGVGDYRLFLCPEGVIKVEDLPENWGLLWVNSRGHVKPQKLDYSTFPEKNHEAEAYIMCRLVQRFNDPEKMNQTLKEASRSSTNAWAAHDRMSQRLDSVSNQMYDYQWKLESLMQEYSLSLEDVSQIQEKQNSALLQSMKRLT